MAKYAINEIVENCDEISQEINEAKAMSSPQRGPLWTIKSLCQVLMGV